MAEDYTQPQEIFGKLAETFRANVICLLADVLDDDATQVSVTFDWATTEIRGNISLVGAAGFDGLATVPVQTHFFSLAEFGGALRRFNDGVVEHYTNRLHEAEIMRQQAAELLSRAKELEAQSTGDVLPAPEAPSYEERDG